MRTRGSKKAVEESKDKEEKEEEDGGNAEDDINTTPVAATIRRGARRKNRTIIGASYNAALSLKKQRKQRSALKSRQSSQQKRRVGFQLTPSLQQTIPPAPSMTKDHITPRRGKLPSDFLVGSEGKRLDFGGDTKGSSGGGGGGGDGDDDGDSGSSNKKRTENQTQPETKVVDDGKTIRDKDVTVGDGKIINNDNGKNSDKKKTKSQTESPTADTADKENISCSSSKNKTLGGGSSSSIGSSSMGPKQKQRHPVVKIEPGLGEDSNNKNKKTGGDSSSGATKRSGSSSTSMHSFQLPNVLQGIDDDVLSTINDNIDHDAIKFDGDINSKLSSFPLRDVKVTRTEDLRVLSRDPEKKINAENPFRLFAGNSICNLFTSWTNDTSSKFIILPACSYIYMKKLDKDDYSKDCLIERYLQNLLGIDTKDLVKKNAIGVPVYGENHYSFACIFYPFKLWMEVVILLITILVFCVLIHYQIMESATQLKELPKYYVDS